MRDRYGNDIKCPSCGAIDSVIRPYDGYDDMFTCTVCKPRFYFEHDSDYYPGGKYWNEERRERDILSY